MTYDYRNHRRRGFVYGPKVTKAPEPLAVTVSRQGIARRPRGKSAATLPVTDSQAQVFALLGDDVRSAARLAAQLGRSTASVTSSLYQLQERGLAERLVGRGWKLK